MTQRHRLPQGGAIERDRVLRFTFDGRAFEGFEGDTLASALLANGAGIVGRSFRLHRPRGLLASGLEEPNCIVTVGEGAAAQTNLKATEVQLSDGLVARSVNAWPSARFDVGSVVSALRPLLVTGFYYKTFMWPRWALYEPLIRRLAGLGRASMLQDPDRYDVLNASCDVLIVGGGPAGLSAALTAAASAASVVLVDADRSFGGTLLAAGEAARIEGVPARTWLARTLATLQQSANVRLLARTLATGYYDHNLVTLVEQLGSTADIALGRNAPRQRLWRLRCSKVILATGAIERPLVFQNNDRPGIMLASAVAMYVNRYAVLTGTDVVIATDNDSAYEVAETVAAKGAPRVTLVDTRLGGRAELSDRMMRAGVRLLPGHRVVAAHGRRRVRAVTVAPCDATGEIDAARAAKLRADLVGVSGGWSPAVHLFSQSGGRLTYDTKLPAFVPSTARQAVTVVGAARGDFDFANDNKRTMWHVRSGKAAQQWVDFQNDVTVDDIWTAATEGYASPEHLKRYTTLGMAVDQGKTANVNALGILADCTGRSLSDIAVTTFRPPYSPIPFGVLAGRRRNDLFVPLRRLAAHERHEALGARFANYGGWLRPECYARGGESFERAVQREALAARTAAVLFDASPLGKIEVKGRDAAKFLSRIYISNIATLQPGAVRYGLMLSEGGTIIDDGVVACLAKDHYQVGTTSAGAQRIAAWLEEWRQCEWPGLDVVTVPVTTQFGTVTLAGPLARTLLSQLVTDPDLSPVAFPHLAVRMGSVAGVAARILRVSYTGELSYEINVPARQVASLWERLLSLGETVGVTPMGIEALMLLRAEKGYIHVGADTDATTIPDDIGFGQIARNRREDFIGRRSLSSAEATRADRWQLVGLDSLASERVIPVGAQCLPRSGAQPPVRPCGRVTSSYFSPTLQRPIALALLERGRQRIGEQIEVYDLGERYAARVAPPTFYDPEGTRLNA